jgi:hypothetical protein
MNLNLRRGQGRLLGAKPKFFMDMDQLNHAYKRSADDAEFDVDAGTCQEFIASSEGIRMRCGRWREMHQSTTP